MSAILGFIAVLTLIAGWWLSRQGLMSKPWLEVDGANAAIETSAPQYAPAQVGLGVFLAVVGSLFSLLITGYLLRSEGADWRTMPLPWIVWPNTFVLLGTSLALELALTAVRHGALNKASTALIISMIGTALFLVGQFATWHVLASSGNYVNSGPADGFFYLMSAAHGLHVIGGMVAQARAVDRVRRGDRRERIELSIELSATYFLFMLFVWILLLLVLSGGAAEFLALCGQILAERRIS